eukprot:TRINITY_DN36172_c0_g1_i1.p1 TRINITY_DN36172_c0_g1~~TRINITY_DN36172_c0_g1_i1.p1  ORF type:complete len:867 (+),score=303.97 TRINITY_DN36172_c0_g1_i1:69-2669(+)
MAVVLPPFEASRVGVAAREAVPEGELALTVPLAACWTPAAALGFLPQGWSARVSRHAAVALHLAAERAQPSSCGDVRQAHVAGLPPDCDTVLSWPEAAMAQLQGSSFAERCHALRQEVTADWLALQGSADARDWLQQRSVTEAGYRWAREVLLARHIGMPDGDHIIAPGVDALRHSADSASAAWAVEEVDGEAVVCVRTVRAVAAGEPLTAFRGPLGNVELLAFTGAGVACNPHDRAEVTLPLPEHVAEPLAQLYPQERIRPGASTHSVTLAEPLPTSLLDAARAGPGPAALLDVLTAAAAGIAPVGSTDGLPGRVAAAVEAEKKVLLCAAATLRLCIRAAGASGAVLAESVAADTMCASAAIAAGHPLALCPLAVVTEAHQEFMRCLPEMPAGLDERQMRTLQLLWLRQRDGSGWVSPPPHSTYFWSSDELLELRGADVLRAGAPAPRDAALSDAMLLRHAVAQAPAPLSGAADSDDACVWAAAVLEAKQMTLQLPGRAVAVQLGGDAPPAVGWVDEDDDEIIVREAGGSLVYAVNGEERPPSRTVALSSGGSSLVFADIDREVDLPGATPDDQAAYRTVLTAVQRLAEKAGIEHGIPSTVVLRWSGGQEFAGVVPGLCMFPHSNDAAPPLVMDAGPLGLGIVVVARAHADLAAGDAAAVNYGPQSNAALLRAHGVAHPGPNPHGGVELLFRIPCRPLGAAESAEDARHGLVLHAANLMAEGGAPVRVDLPDLEQLQAGAPGLCFTIRHTLSTSCPLPRSLLCCETLRLLSTDGVAAAREHMASAEALCRSAEAAAAERSAALRAVRDRAAERLAAYPTSLERDEELLRGADAMPHRARLALVARLGEKRVLQGAILEAERLAAA